VRSTDWAVWNLPTPPSFQTVGDAKHCLRDLESPGNSRVYMEPSCQKSERLMLLIPISFVCRPSRALPQDFNFYLGAYATKLWSVAPPGLYGSDESLRGVSLRSTPSLYYFAHKGLSHRHQSVHSVKSLENRSCSFPSFRKSAFHLNLRHLRNLRAFHSSFSVLSASLCGKNTNPVHPSHPVICVPSRLLVMDYALW